MDLLLPYLQHYFGSILSFETFGLNILDIVMLIIIAFYAYEGYMLGFLYASLDLLSFVISFLLALALYATLGEYIMQTFGIPPGLSNALGFFLLALVSEVLVSLILRRILLFMPGLRDHNTLHTFFYSS